MSAASSAWSARRMAKRGSGRRGIEAAEALLGAGMIHHLSEVCLLRDLYLHAKPATNGATR